MISEMVLLKSTSFELLKEMAIQCSTFDSTIYLIKGCQKADVKDLTHLVTLSLHPYDHISLIIDGPDAAVAAEKIHLLLN